MKNRLSVLLAALIVLVELTACSSGSPSPVKLVAPSSGNWISLFNGKNLDGWVPKISGHDVNDNFGNTFRVQNGVMRVAYDQYQNFGQQFGSLFYRQKFSNYWLRVEYRFVGDQAAGAPSWAKRDSGLQLHSQAAETMLKDQQFPVSVEFNLLGGGWLRKRPTGDVCTNGTHVVIGGQLLTDKCGKTSTVTIRGDQWVTVEAEVHGSQTVRQFVNGELVTEYGQLTLDGQDVDAQRLIAAGANQVLSEGYISLQSNSHPVEFRKIELLPLDQ